MENTKDQQAMQFLLIDSDRKLIFSLIIERESTLNLILMARKFYQGQEAIESFYLISQFLLSKCFKSTMTSSALFLIYLTGMFRVKL